MTKEEQKLLLKDLCARLPYHPNCSCKWLEKAPNGTNGYVQELSTFVIDEIEIMDDPQFKCQICDVKPYLRPMSSMTEEEAIAIFKIIYGQDMEFSDVDVYNDHIEIWDSDYNEDGILDKCVDSIYFNEIFKDNMKILYIRMNEFNINLLRF